MSAIQMIAIGRKLSNIYSELSLPICKKYGINQTCFDILLFFANNPKHNTARDICEVRGIKSGIASVSILIENGFLVRKDDESDRRRRRLILTEKADPVISDGKKMQKYFTETLKKDITPKEMAAFQSLTDKLNSNIALFGKKDQSQCLK